MNNIIVHKITLEDGVSEKFVATLQIVTRHDFHESTLRESVFVDDAARDELEGFDALNREDAEALGVPYDNSELEGYFDEIEREEK